MRLLHMIRSGRRLLIVCALPFAFCLAGCESQPRVNIAEAAEPTARPTAIDDRRVIRDARLSRYVELVNLFESASPAGLKIVEAELYNASANRRAIRYRFQWFGPEGLAIDSGASVWRDRALLSGERARISGIAPNDRANDFQLDIIAAR
ncbi:MAG: DUF1425 domain-containing protein [Phycisphaeraceae bacterium]|nr:MAG: DUF1425 domain-containing protein [Phycisphaeraceae bacterium]